MPGTTWNPADKGATVTLTNGNLTATGTTTAAGVRATDFKTTGKFYWECQPTTTISGTNTDIGFGLSTSNLATAGANGNNAVLILGSNAGIFVNGTNSGTIGTGSLFIVGLLVACAIDFGGKLAWFRAIQPAGYFWNGSSSNNPATAVGGVSFSSMSGNWYPMLTFNSANAIVGNFAGPFIGPMPSGFSAFDPSAAVVQARVMVMA